MSGLAVSISLLVAAFVAVIVGMVLPPDLALWGIAVAGALLVGSIIVFLLTLIRLRRAKQR